MLLSQIFIRFIHAVTEKVSRAFIPALGAKAEKQAGACPPEVA